MYSLTFRVRVTTPRSMDEMEWRTQQARRFYSRRGESSPACLVRAACAGPGGLPPGNFFCVRISKISVSEILTLKGFLVANVTFNKGH